MIPGPGLYGWPALLAVISLLIMAQLPAAAQTDGRRVYELGTGTPASLSHPVGVTLAALIKLRLLPRANINIDARNTQGSRDNIVRLRNGDLGFAILTGLDAYDALRGNGPFAGDSEDSNLRHLTNLWTSSFHLVVRPEDATTGTFADFLNLPAKRIAVGVEGSTLRDQARALFAALDVDVETAYQLQELDGRQGAQAFLDGDLDGLLLVDDRQGADLAAFLERAGDGATVLRASDDEIDRILDQGGPAWTRITIQADGIPDQREPYAAVGVHNLLGASERVADDVINQITRTLFDNLPFLREMHPATAGIGLETALEHLVLPVHDGAATYYREVGIDVPEPRRIPASTLSETPFLTRYDTVDTARSVLSESTFTILAGKAGHTTPRMIGELAASLADAEIRLVGMSTPRPSENLADLLYARGVDGAIMPLDILNYALQQDIYPDLQRKIRYNAELFPEEIHLLASDAFEDIDDLIDQPVNLGPPGSFSEFTASFLLDRLNIPVKPTYHEERTALTLLARGDLAAVFLISGKPMPLLLELPDTPDFRLLAVPALEGDAYRSASLSADDYPNLISPGEVIGTFGIRTALLSYNWRSDNPRYLALANFIDAFFNRLPSLSQPDSGYHPKWREINPSAEISGWPRSAITRDWLEAGERPVDR